MGMDQDGDGAVYDRNINNENGGIEGGSENDEVDA